MRAGLLFMVTIGYTLMFDALLEPVTQVRSLET